MHRGRSRKGRVLHTRVPEVLEVELKRLADSLSVPVSNIVRAVLEDALEVAENVEEDIHADMEDAAERMKRWRERRERRRKRRRERGKAHIEVKLEGLRAREKAAREIDEREARGEAPVPDDAAAETAAAEAPAEAATDHDDGRAEADGHDDVPAELPPGVVGVQPMTMVRSGECLLCKQALARGDDAFLGVGAVSGPPVIVCPDCAP